MDFKSKAVPGKFNGSGRHSNCNRLQDWTNFHRCHGWLIFQLFNTGTCNTLTHIFRVTDPLWGEFAGQRWIPLTKTADAELWHFLRSEFIQAQIKENIKAPHHWPLCGDFRGERWIPRTNSQWRGKCFHLMTPSWKTGIGTCIYER